jgi:hypothetical protein
MPAGSVRFVFHDGQMLTLAEAELAEVYELLWTLAPKPGAVSVAALIRGTARADVFSGAPIDLNVPQSAAMREAVALLRT